MLGSDIVVVGVEGTGVLMRDYYTNYESFPFSPYMSYYTRNATSIPIDTSQSQLFPIPDCSNGGTDDWSLLDYSSESVNSIFCQRVTITRKFLTEDPNDRVIQFGLQRFIAAYGTFNNNKPLYHGPSRFGFQMLVPSTDTINSGLAPEVIPFECNLPNCYFREYRMSNYTIPPFESKCILLYFSFYIMYVYFSYLCQFRF